MSLWISAVIIALIYRVVIAVKQKAIGPYFITFMPLVTQLYHL